MLTIATILAAPAIMMLAARLISRQRAVSRGLALFEYLFDGAALFLLSVLVLGPLGRVTIRTYPGNPLSIEYGKLAAMIDALAAALLGALQGRLRARWTATLLAPVAPGAAHRLITPGRAACHLLGALMTFTTFAYLWGIRNYPLINIDQILFHLRMPMEGTAESFFEGIWRDVFAPTAACCAAYALWAFASHRLLRRRLCLTLEGVGLRVGILPGRLGPLLAALVMGAWAVIFLPGLNVYLGVVSYVNGRIHQSTFIEEHYVDPARTAIVFPEQKRNLITVYIESAESTFQDEANGGVAPVNYIPEMTRLARENVSFSQSELVQGAAVTPGGGWTIAGLVAQTSGLPLKYSRAGIDDNDGDKLASLLPGATTLGDILRAQGYRTAFLCGSDFTFGGRRRYFTQHGDYEVWDLLSIQEEGLLSEDYAYIDWGVADRELYAIAREKLSMLSAGEEPFHLAILTVDTHMPGFPCELCPDTDEDPILRTTACASRQVDDFVRWCREQPFFENTTIVITGDHAAMTSPKILTGIPMSALDIHGGTADRLVYNAFINPAIAPAREKNRRFTTLDIFPTTLASLGVAIEGDRLGLGTNLFSERETLAEAFGYDELFDGVGRVSYFYNERLLFP